MIWLAELNQQTVMAQSFEALLPVLTLLLTWGSAELARFIRLKIKNETAAAALVRLNDAVSVAVGEVGQTLVPVARQITRDGSISPEEAERLKEVALAKVHKILNQRGVTEVQKVLQIDDFNAWVEAKIEAAIAAEKTARS